MKDRIADPRALGFAALAIMVWMDSMVGAGWYGMSGAMGMLVAVTTLAWLALLVAAFAAFLRNDSWHATFFMFWSAVIWGFHAALHGAMGPMTAYVGWFYIAIAVVGFFFFLAALRAAVGIAEVLVAAGLTLTFVFDGLAGWFGGSVWMLIGGYIGLVTGLAAFWAMASGLNGAGAPAGAAQAGGVASGTL